MSRKARPFMKVTRAGEGITVEIIGFRGGVRHVYSRSITTKSEGRAGLEAAMTEAIEVGQVRRFVVERVNPK